MKKVSRECMAGAAERVQNRVTCPCVPLPHRTVPLNTSWLSLSSPWPCTAPSLNRHLCCYSTTFTLGLPWASCCLHISCRMCSFPGAGGMPCILMHSRADTSQLRACLMSSGHHPGSQAARLRGPGPANLQPDSKTGRVAGGGTGLYPFKPLFYQQILQTWTNFSHTRSGLEAQIKSKSD